MPTRRHRAFCRALADAGLVRVGGGHPVGTWRRNTSGVAHGAIGQRGSLSREKRAIVGRTGTHPHGDLSATKARWQPNTGPGKPKVEPVRHTISNILIDAWEGLLLVSRWLGPLAAWQDRLQRLGIDLAAARFYQG